MLQQLREGLKLVSLQQVLFLCSVIFFTSSLIVGFLYHVSTRGALPDILLRHLWQADQFAAQGHLDEAAAAYMVAAQVAPDDLEALSRLYTTADDSGDQRTAWWALSRSLRLNPRDPVVNLQVADRLYQQGDYSQARQFYARVTRLAPTSAEAAFRLGLAEIQLGEVDAAERWFRRALELQPGHPGAETYLRRLATKKGQPL